MSRKRLADSAYTSGSPPPTVSADAAAAALASSTRLTRSSNRGRARAASPAVALAAVPVGLSHGSNATYRIVTPAGSRAPSALSTRAPAPPTVVVRSQHVEPSASAASRREWSQTRGSHIAPHSGNAVDDLLGGESDPEHDDAEITLLQRDLGLSHHIFALISRIINRDSIQIVGTGRGHLGSTASSAHPRWFATLTAALVKPSPALIAHPSSTDGRAQETQAQQAISARISSPAKALKQWPRPLHWRRIGQSGLPNH